MWRKIVNAGISCLIFGLIILIYYKGLEISSNPINSWIEDHQADCAVVLTGGPGRVREGFDLLAQKQVRKLIVSGVYHGATLREIFPQIPFYGSVRSEDVILERRSLTTYGNAQQSLPLVEALHCRDIVIVTSNIHMPRARRIFRQVFPDQFPIYERSVNSGGHGSFTIVVWMEAIKSLFYGLWAY